MTLVERLREAGSTGLDLSPGDPLCAEAADEIERLLAQFDELDAKIEGLENHIISLEQDAELPEDEYSYRVGFDEGFTMAHEPAGCGHARANWKDPNYGTPEYDGNEQCEFCAAQAVVEGESE